MYLAAGAESKLRDNRPPAMRRRNTHTYVGTDNGSRYLFDGRIDELKISYESDDDVIQQRAVGPGGWRARLCAKTRGGWC